MAHEEPEAFRIDHIYEEVDNNPDVDSASLAESIVRRAGDAAIRQFAVHYVESRIDACRRVLARRTEESATVNSIGHDTTFPMSRPVRNENQKTAKERRESRESNFTEIRDSMAVYNLHSNQRDLFRDWMGEGFEDWLDQCKKNRFAQADNPFDAEYRVKELDSFFNPNEVRRPERPDPLMVWNWRLEQSISAFAETIRLEVTEDLLATQFALGDGTAVTWGRATVEQHQKRIGLLVKNAAGNMETAGRHEAAIRMIRDAEATCLQDVNGRGAQARNNCVVPAATTP